MSRKVIVKCDRCDKFIDMKCIINDNSPLYRCTHKIVELFVEGLSAGDKVLEVGCGSWSLCRDLCLQKGVKWEGVDPIVRENKKNLAVIATKRGSVHAIPFADNYFDYVICNQTIEHWHEFGVSFEEGMSEIYRVLNPSGKFVINAPIYLHGQRQFLLNNYNIETLFPRCLWDNLTIEEWRHEEHKVPYIGWEKCRFSDQVFPQLKNRSSFVVNFHGQKKVGSKPVSVIKFSLIRFMKRQFILVCKYSRPLSLFSYHLHYGGKHLFYKLFKKKYNLFN